MIAKMLLPLDSIFHSKWKLLHDTKSKFQIANKYFDNIILNHPTFEVYGYYSKLLLYLNNYNRWNTKEFLLESGLDDKAESLMYKENKKYWQVINNKVGSL